MVVRGPSGAEVVVSTVGEVVRAFVPASLPPTPPLELTDAHHDLMERANRSLGRLDGLTTVLPSTPLFVYMYVRKEAVLSSQIEGTRSSLSDLLLHETGEAPGAPFDDVAEVSSYVAAMDHGLARLREGFPLSLRLLREIHARLLEGGRGAEKTPGEFRRTQNWIGGSRPGSALFVPPPPDRLVECLDPFEKFLHDDPVRTPLLIKAALAHAWFETIHPFLDGNGRLGRLLITLLLCAENALSAPTLYLSLWFKQHRADYYDHLQRTRTHGTWEEWLQFFLEGVYATSQQAVETAKVLLELFERDRARIESRLGRRAGSALRLFEHLKKHPLTPIGAAARQTGLSEPTVTSLLGALIELDVVREVTGRKRGRVFAYQRYLDVLSEGTEPLPR